MRSESLGFLAALQLADSALPIGRFVHSYGLEAWLRDRAVVQPETLMELIEASLCDAVAPLDGVLLARAYEASSIPELIALDSRLTARKLTPPARSASQSCGRQLAALAPKLAPSDTLIAQLARAVRGNETDGNLAIVEGSLARALGTPKREAVLVELRSAAAGLLSAAVRLGAISPLRAQTVLAELAPALARAGDEALTLGTDELSATTPELEVFALAHSRSDARLFAT